MIYCFDIDGTVCSETYGDYTNAKPIIERVEIINKLYDNGHTIYFYTARGMGRSNNNQNLAHEKLYQYTKNQLDSWNIKYHKLFFGKPKSDYYIDDKNILPNMYFKNL